MCNCLWFGLKKKEEREGVFTVDTWFDRLAGSPASFPHEHFTVCPLISVLWTATIAWVADSLVANLRTHKRKYRKNYYYYHRIIFKRKLLPETKATRLSKVLVWMPWFGESIRLEEAREKVMAECVPYESISFVFEHSDLLDLAEGWECFLHQLLREPICNTSAVDSAVRLTWLVVHLIKCQLLTIPCRWN